MARGIIFDTCHATRHATRHVWTHLSNLTDVNESRIASPVFFQYHAVALFMILWKCVCLYAIVKMDLRNWNHEFFTEFIELYKSYPCLWRVKDKDYGNRDKKRIAYEALVKKCKEVDPEATKDYVTKKINSFRTVYRKERKKMKNSTRSGAGTEDVYTPTLWYFPMLRFLDDQDHYRRSLNTMQDPQVR